MKFLQQRSQKGSDKPPAEQSNPALADQNVTPTGNATFPKLLLLQSPDRHIFCTVRPAWTWVMQSVCQQVDPQQQAKISLVSTHQDLPSGKLASLTTTAAEGMSSSPSSGIDTSTSSRGRTRRNKTKSNFFLNTLRIDVVTNCLPNSHRNWSLQAFHGTSEAFDGLEDKDEFVRTLKRCRCEHLELSPPSVLINWDVSKTECLNLVGNSMPSLLSNDQQSSKRVAVLKEPMGKSGAGVFFVHDAEEIHEIIEQHRKKAVEEPGFLDDLISQKGRIPSWVLQAEVRPCLLVRDRRKFHIRTYIVCVENIMLECEGDQEDEEIMKLFIYNRHEIRIANGAVPDEDTGDRDRNVHIMDASAERKLLREEPELLKRNLRGKVELFAAQTFAKHLRSDIERRIALSAAALEEENDDAYKSMVLPHKFVVAGLDLMVTEDERIYLLEVNVNPSAPSPETVSPDFQSFLLGFQKDLMELVTTRGESSTNFWSTEEILQRKR